MQGALTQALQRLMVVVERYPELKADQRFADLQRQLEGTENRIAVERRRFTENVAVYNNGVRRFPGRIIAGILGYNKVYLTTDHIQFYEKFGFREIGLDKFVTGRPTKIYEVDVIK